MTVTPGGAHPILAGERALYAGQPVAAIVANSAGQAADAAACISIEYEPLPAIKDLESAASDTVPLLHESMGSNVGAHQRIVAGDVGAEFARAYRVVSGSFVVPRLAPMAMEGRAAVADFNQQNGDLTYWSSNQAPHETREHIQETLAISGHIHVITPDVGGGFGHKHHLYPEEVVTIVCSMRFGRPARWIEERAENIHSSHGRGIEGSIQAAVQADGTILALKTRLLADLGAYWISGVFTSPDNALKRITGPYDIRAYDGELLCVMTNRPPVTAYRGAGQPEGTFFMERTLDLISNELELDPVEVRRRNLIGPDRFPYTTVAGIPYVDGDYEPVLDRAIAVSDYAGLRAVQSRARQDGRFAGIGVALSNKGSGGVGGESSRSSAAKITVSPDGNVELYTDISPHGQGNATTFAQIAADALGVAPTSITVRHGDTDDLQPFGPGSGTYASRGLVIGGHAVHKAAQEVRAKLIGAASQLLEIPPDEIEIMNGVARTLVGPPSRSVELGRLVELVGDRGSCLTHYTTFTLPPGSFAFATHIAYVEVDADTGAIDVQRYFAIHDCGNLINPMIVEGQIHGGLAQGLGEGLMEEIAYEDDGRPTSWSFMDYGIPLAEDLPYFTVRTHATEAKNGALGVRGVGEMPSVASPVAIANAVHDALRPIGVSHVDIPLTQERVWRAIEAARTGSI
jgi:carbon-monoxide dehydrogenase large subunit